MKKILAAGMLLSIMLFSCATPLGLDNGHGVLKAVELVNTGDWAKLTALSKTPFLIDGQIIYGIDDIREFWKTLADSDYLLDGASIKETKVADTDAAKAFGQTKDVALYFGKYVPKDAHVALVETSKGSFYFLLAGNKGGYPYIYGIGGPK